LPFDGSEAIGEGSIRFKVREKHFVENVDDAIAGCNVAEGDRALAKLDGACE
jgi:hypothetical protein